MARLLLRSMRAAGSSIRTGWLILGLTLLLIIVCEAGLRLALTTKDRLTDRPRSWTTFGLNEREVTATYPGVEWLPDYFKELQTAAALVWHPYVYWRTVPHRGRYITVNQNGLRATWNPPPRDGAAAPPPVRVFTFGGSAMWGWGARDDYTIASYLSQLLDAKGYRAEVTNYGQVAYVTTQEVIALLRRIQHGDIPDIVLFYHGINDTFSSHNNGEAGVSMHEQTRRKEFNLSRQPKRLAQRWGHRVLDEQLWGFQRSAAGLRRRIWPSAALHTKPEARPSSAELGRQTVRRYAANLAIVESLGRSYGFDPLFYWQPAIFSKRHRSPHEQLWARRFAFLERTYDAIYRRIRRSEILNSRPHFHNISALFDDLEEPYYWDYCHTSEAGSRRIARAMADDVIELIERRRTAAAGKATQ